MKNYFNQLLIIAALIIVGCSDDPCKDVVCGPGTCDDGTCICPAGYEGNSCETLENEKYFGLYTFSDVDCGIGGDFEATSMTISAKTDGGVFDITIVVIDPDESLSLDGTLNNGRLEVSGVVEGISISFDGDFTDVNTLVGENTIDIILTKLTCTFVAKR